VALDVPGPYLVGAVGDELGADAGRVGGLGAAVADLVAAGQDPVHGADAAVVAALVEQDGPGLGRGLVGEPVAVQGVDDLLSFFFGKGGRMRRALAWLLFRDGGARVLGAPESSPGFPDEAACLTFRGNLDEGREEFFF
jgi:hypothetical protein